MRGIIAIAVLILCVAAQAAEIRGSVQVQTIVTTNVTTNASVSLPARSGQTNVYQTGDDGYYQKGVTNPVPRFTVLSEPNQIRDNLTGLIWAKDTNIGGTMNWSNAIVYCESLVYGGTNDWRLPTIKELYTLVDYRYDSPCICNTIGNSICTANDPFQNLSAGGRYFWSSTTEGVGSQALYLYTGNGAIGGFIKSGTIYVWPVRGGQ